MLDCEQALADLIPEGRTGPEVNVLRYWRGNKAVMLAAMTSGTNLNVDPIKMRANHGRWIVECPTGDGGAQFASRFDRRFMCQECLNNATAGRQWLRVEWPPLVSEIAALLDNRFDAEDRNWEPGQTLEELAAENVLLRVRWFLRHRRRSDPPPPEDPPIEGAP